MHDGHIHPAVSARARVPRRAAHMMQTVWAVDFASAKWMRWKASRALRAAVGVRRRSSVQSTTSRGTGASVVCGGMVAGGMVVLDGCPSAETPPAEAAQHIWYVCGSTCQAQLELGTAAGSRALNVHATGVNRQRGAGAINVAEG
eukprot:CAMPEP_0181212930 /NCGR_PEP_ID=MMETSP1096-20121128/24629_1 /TAXON_ID=156174 ORGANISM="Chrysochromulina ericina, Strain CCMP281" /NCGR_SAMPLE_ID=MMETSP1096 /ASSEMBLY_ACC=CAM_ASM_000453 /LENGTH=144 /DNA_ID=CAMNT_0023304525 /DNA_START=505 /DNA_END=936 /DNA_ORIENTATION=+